MDSDHRHTLALALVALALATGLTAPAAALTPYDPPVLTVVESGYYNLVLEVQAGPSGTPAGFGLQWMTEVDYALLGGWPADPAHPALHECRFTGVPTLHLGSGAATYRLAPGDAVRVEPGDFFDDTGVATDNTGPLVPGIAYVMRAVALGDADGLASGYTYTIRTLTMYGECALGFWRHHPDAWPASALPMPLGTVAYTYNQLLLVFNTPAAGNGLSSLAHQLIAAKLNLASGSDPTPILGTVAAADALIGPLVAPPLGGGWLDPAVTGPLTQVLDDYNNGRIMGVGPCAAPALRTSWGNLKGLYR